MKNLHEGHRERVRKKFLKYGLDCFSEHEVLELLLFYAVPRVNTNEMAHELLGKFKTLGGVLDAPIEALTETKSLSENGATLLKLVPQILKLYPKTPDSTSLDSFEVLKAFFKTEFLGAEKEQIRVCCLNNSLNVLACELVATGDVGKVTVNPLGVVELALKYNSRTVIVAHNHIGAVSLPSKEDITSTRMLRRALDPLGIDLLDHVIVSDFGDVTSMRQGGYMSMLDK